METVRIGIIGGSGLYQMPELLDVEEVEVDTPFGSPSDAFIVGTLENQRVAFLPRHARGHRFTPTFHLWLCHARHHGNPRALGSEERCSYTWRLRGPDC